MLIYCLDGMWLYLTLSLGAFSRGSMVLGYSDGVGRSKLKAREATFVTISDTFPVFKFKDDKVNDPESEANLSKLTGPEANISKLTGSEVNVSKLTVLKC